jgi:hypothetical protein
MFAFIHRKSSVGYPSKKSTLARWLRSSILVAVSVPAADARDLNKGGVIDAVTSPLARALRVSLHAAGAPSLQLWGHEL